MTKTRVVTWVTKHGKRIAISQMTDLHLDNAIASIERGIVEQRDRLIADTEEKLEEIILRIGDDARSDCYQIPVDSQLAAALAPGYNAILDRYLLRLEQLKAGNPSGYRGYDELIEERDQRRNLG